MIYLTIKLLTVLFIYKVITIGPFTSTASTLIIPLWFLIGDVIAEVYGYKISRQIIWIALICQFIFAFACVVLIKFNSPPFWQHQAAYEQVLGNLPRVAIASFLAIVCGAFLNAYLLTKWKILLKGKYFWLRSLGASTIGEAAFTLSAFVTEFLGIVPFATLLELVVISFITKILMGLLFVTPSSLLAAILKKIEGIDESSDLSNLQLAQSTLIHADFRGKIA